MKKELILTAIALCGAAVLSAASWAQETAPDPQRADAARAEAKPEAKPELREKAFSVSKVVTKVRKGVIRVQGIDVSSPVVAYNPGGGSGFVFEVNYDTHTAYGITNFHVSGNNMVSAVQFWNGAQYRAEKIAGEPGIDIALLEIQGIPDERHLSIDERTIVPVTLGDSDQVRIGELALAMGNPGNEEGINVNRSQPWEAFLMGQTVTTNVVTGRDTPLDFEIGIWENSRNGPSILSWQYGTNLPYAFRVSVPINPGNSGGPLFNGQGEVIGVNFYGGAFYLSQNHNWSIPINVVKDFATQILETGKFERPWMGIDIIMPPYVTRASQYEEFIERYKPDRLEIYGVRAGSNAERDGLKTGDVILEIDGQQFKDPEQVRLYILNLDVGTKVSLTIQRKDPNTKRYKKLPEPIIVEVGPKRTFNSEFSV